MYCDHCGRQIPDQALFCPGCGEKIIRMDSKSLARAEKSAEMVTENIQLCPDGIYRWSYEYDMLKNPVILGTVMKVMGISFGAVFLVVLISDLLQGSGSLAAMVRMFLILAAVFLVITLLSYLIVAAMYGWKYQVLFEMSETEVSHIQMPKQFSKAEALGWLTALAGAASGTTGMTAAGLSAAARSVMTTEFSKVKSIRVRRNHHTIHVDQGLDRNQVYAEDRDFDFVREFIISRCPDAKVS